MPRTRRAASSARRWNASAPRRPAPAAAAGARTPGRSTVRTARRASGARSAARAAAEPADRLPAIHVPERPRSPGAVADPSPGKVRIPGEGQDPRGRSGGVGLPGELQAAVPELGAGAGVVGLGVCLCLAGPIEEPAGDLGEGGVADQPPGRRDTLLEAVDAV